MTEYINIVVAQRGAESVRRDLANIGTGADAAGRSVALLQRALGVLSVGFGLSQLKDIVDGYTNLSNRLRLVATDTQNLAQLQEAVFQAAQRTRTPFEAMANLYGRTAMNAAALGLSQQEVLDMTESVSQAFKISGATSAEASGAIIQFTQGLAQGTLRGQELNSVLEQAPRLAQAIADGLGVGVYDLKALGKEGKITAEAIADALKKAGPELQAEFDKLKPTIDDAFTVLNNGFMRVIGQFDQATGASAAFANMLITVGNNAELMTVIISTIAGLLIAVFLPTMAAAVAAIWSFAVAATIATGGLNLLIPLIVGGAAAIAMWGDDWVVNMETGASLLDYLRAGFSMLLEAVAPAGQFISQVFGGAWNFLQETWGKVGEFFSQSNDEILGIFGVFYRVLVALFGGLVGAIIAAFQNMPAAIEAIFKNMFNELVNITEFGINGIISALNLIPNMNIPPADLSGYKQQLSDDAADVGGIIAQGFQDGFAQGDLAAQQGLASITAAWDDLTLRAARERAMRELRDKLSPDAPDGTLPTTPGTPVTRSLDDEEKKRGREKATLAGILQDYEREIGLLRMSNDEREIQKQLYADIEKLRKDGVTLSPLEAGALEDQIRLLKQVEEQSELLGSVLDRVFSGAEDAFIQFIETGKVDFSSLITSMISDIARLAFQSFVTKPLTNILGNVLGGVLGGLGGAGGLQPGGPGFLGGGASSWGPTFATGGSFVVGGNSSAVDGNLVQFRASKGERVSIGRNDMNSDGGGKTSIVFNISTPDVQGFKQSETQIAARMSRLAARGNRAL